MLCAARPSCGESSTTTPALPCTAPPSCGARHGRPTCTQWVVSIFTTRPPAACWQPPRWHPRRVHHASRCALPAHLMYLGQLFKSGVCDDWRPRESVWQLPARSAPPRELQVHFAEPECLDRETRTHVACLSSRGLFSALLGAPCVIASMRGAASKTPLPLPNCLWTDIMRDPSSRCSTATGFS